MVAQWLAAYMFRGLDNSTEKALLIARWFADYNHFKSHGRPVGYDQLKELDLNVRLLEEDQDFLTLPFSLWVICRPQGTRRLEGYGANASGIASG